MKQKLTPTGMKILKIVHLLCVVAWMGTAIILNCVRLFISTNDPAGMYYVAAVLDAIDMKVLVPAAICCLLTGFVYGIWTNWGFFRHRWLTVKWILTIFMIALGTFYIGPMMEENVEIARAVVEGSGDAAPYWENITAINYSGLLQVGILLFVVVISVLKPWKKKRTANTTAAK